MMIKIRVIKVILKRKFTCIYPGTHINFSVFVIQLAHGADPFLRNQEGQTPVELASADDVRSLLQDAMASQNVPTTSASTALSFMSSSVSAIIPSVSMETVIMPSGAAVQLSTPIGSRGSVAIAEGCCSALKLEGGFLFFKN